MPRLAVPGCADEAVLAAGRPAMEGDVSWKISKAGDGQEVTLRDLQAFTRGSELLAPS